MTKFEQGKAVQLDVVFLPKRGTRVLNKPAAGVLPSRPPAKREREEAVVPACSNILDSQESISSLFSPTFSQPITSQLDSTTSSPTYHVRTRSKRDGLSQLRLSLTNNGIDDVLALSLPFTQASPPPASKAKKRKLGKRAPKNRNRMLKLTRNVIKNIEEARLAMRACAPQNSDAKHLMASLSKAVASAEQLCDLLQ